MEDQTTHQGTVENIAAGSTPDALAYYLPFHFYPRTWGIYVWASGVCSLADHLDSSAKVAVLDFSYRLLLEHERLHFFAEYAASRVEVMSGKSCYREYFTEQNAALHEEALANAHALFRLVRSASKVLSKKARGWMAAQPQGYGDFGQWLPPRFEEGRRRAGCFMSRNILTVWPRPTEFLFYQIRRPLCPVRIVIDSNVDWLRVGKPFPKSFGLQVYVFPNDHKPPHIHIDSPPGTPYTRYAWPDLTPLPKDARLRSSEEKALRHYVEIYGAEIARKVAAVQWQ